MATRKVRLALVGLGTVAKGLLTALCDDAVTLEKRYGFTTTITGVTCKTHGAFVDPDGFEPAALLRKRHAEPPDSGSLGRKVGETVQLPVEAQADILIETTGVTLGREQEGVARMRRALEAGISVVTSSKWPIATALLELQEVAARNNARLRYESTVLSGTPALSMLREGVAGTHPLAVRGIVNAVSNLILTRMAQGANYHEALGETQRLGLTEPDPSADVDGWDALSKALVLAQVVFGVRPELNSVPRQGVSTLDPNAVRRATRKGKLTKEVCRVWRDEEGGVVQASVSCETLDASDWLGKIDGVQCALEYISTPLGQVRIVGPGAGPELAGQGALSDLIEIARTM